MLRPKSFSELISALGIFGAIVSFVFAVVQWKSNQEQQNQKLAEERSKITDQRRIEAQKPFLDLQIQLYGEAVRITTRLANHADVGKLEKRVR